MSAGLVARFFTGTPAARTHGAVNILRKRATVARSVARNEVDQDSPFAASLRGKAKGFDEAADLLERLSAGRRLRGRHDSPRGG